MATNTLLQWLDTPSRDHGIWFYGGADSWSFESYESLAAKARTVALRLRQLGVDDDTIVVISLRRPLDFVAGFFGAMMLGATPAPVAPLSATRVDWRTTNLRHAIDTVEANPGTRAFVVADPDVIGELGSTGQFRTPSFAMDLAADSGSFDGAILAPSMGLLQLTSGTTGTPKAIRVPMTALMANIWSIHEWLGQDETMAWASWMPLYHDMGLIGCLLSPLAAGADVHLMTAEQFIRSPSAWLRALGRNGCVFSGTTNFGLDIVSRRVRARDLEGCDFSGLRSVVVGAERIDPLSLSRFVEVTENSGFEMSMLCPAYGLGEATLAVCGTVPGTSPTVLRVARDSLQYRGVIKPAHDGSGGTVGIVSCGRPLPGVDVAIWSGEDPSEEMVLGEIVVTAPSVAAGYLGGRQDEGGPKDGCVRTGDIGFLSNGELFLVGRMGDGIKRYGRWIFAEDIDITLRRLLGPTARAAALLGTASGSDLVVALVEGIDQETAGRLGEALLTAVGCCDIEVRDVPRHSILRTTSGKVRRRILWDRLTRGELPGRTQWASLRDGMVEGTGR